MRFSCVDTGCNRYIQSENGDSQMMNIAMRKTVMKTQTLLMLMVTTPLQLLLRQGLQCLVVWLPLGVDVF